MIVPKVKQYITELILCVASFVYAFVRGWAKTCGAPKHVLVWQMAKLGDMVCTTPMFRALKNNYPDVLITVVGNTVNKQILEGNADIEEYMVFDGFVSVLKRIKDRKYDAGFIVTPSVIALAAFFLGGVHCISAPRIRNGFSPYETGIYRALLFFVSEHPHFMEYYAPREYLRLLESINIFTDDTKKYLKFSEEAEQKILNLLKNNDFDLEKDLIVGISPSAGNKIKQWPPKRFAEVAEYIYKKYSGKIIIIGGPNDQAEVGEMIKNMGNKTVFLNTQGALNIDELKAMISKLKIFISVDTGPIYIAEAFEVSTIDIVGPMDEKEQPPIGERHKIVKSENRLRPELHIMNARVYDEKEAKRQVESITVDMVINEFEDLTKKIRAVS